MTETNPDLFGGKLTIYKPNWQDSWDNVTAQCHICDKVDLRRHGYYVYDPRVELWTHNYYVCSLVCGDTYILQKC